jgi:hypothetical protein
MNALREMFEQQASEVHPPDFDASALVGLGEARLRRRRRTAVLRGAIAVVIAVAALLAGGQTRGTTPQPAGPAPTQVRPSAYPELPLTRFKGAPTRINEFLLQYPDPLAADQAMVNAVQRMTQCPSPEQNGVLYPDDVRISHDPGGVSADASWGAQRQAWPSYSATPFDYAFHVARADNVLVVVEGTMPSDRGPTILTRAVRTALPEYRVGRVVPGGEVIASQPYMVTGFFDAVRQPGLPPQLSACVDDPNTWGAVKVMGASFVREDNHTR